jgi:hypothetical protein
MITNKHSGREIQTERDGEAGGGGERGKSDQRAKAIARK